MGWTELFTTYGSYVTLLLLALTYFFKRHYDLKSKKIELHYSFFQQGKIDAIKNFFEAYGKVERMWHQFSIHKVIQKEYSTTDLDNKIWPTMNLMQTALYQLSLYLPEHELKLFENIYNSFSKVNGIVSKIYFDDLKGNSTEKSNEFSYGLYEAVEETKKQLKIIGESTRKKFNA